jgi:DNA-binding transcriptional LysR family regulator
MELRHLRSFIAVVECKGYREASRRLHIAQPSISEAVSDLEDELGLTLFSRTNRNARETPEGEIFYADAVRILQQAETAGLSRTAHISRLSNCQCGCDPRKGRS